MSTANGGGNRRRRVTFLNDTPEQQIPERDRKYPFQGGDGGGTIKPLPAPTDIMLIKREKEILIDDGKGNLVSPVVLTDDLNQSLITTSQAGGQPTRPARNRGQSRAISDKMPYPEYVRANNSQGNGDNGDNSRTDDDNSDENGENTESSEGSSKESNDDDDGKEKKSRLFLTLFIVAVALSLILVILYVTSPPPKCEKRLNNVEYKNVDAEISITGCEIFLRFQHTTTSQKGTLIRLSDKDLSTTSPQSTPSDAQATKKIHNGIDISIASESSNSSNSNESKIKLTAYSSGIDTSHQFQQTIRTVATPMSGRVNDCHTLIVTCTKDYIMARFKLANKDTWGIPEVYDLVVFPRPIKIVSMQVGDPQFVKDNLYINRAGFSTLSPPKLIEKFCFKEQVS